MKINTTQHALWAGLLLCTAVGAYAVPVTFVVDMSYRTTLGLFNTDGSDHIEVQSGFNLSWPNWGGHELTNVPSTTLYQNTFDVTSPAPGSVVEYKFHTWGTHGNWEDLGWYPNGNRRFTLASSAQTIPSAYFNDNSGGAQSIQVIFQVDMSAQIGAGFFNPASDLIQAMGPFNSSWSGIVLNADSARPGIYTNSYVETSRAPGTRMEYKWAINVAGGGTLSYESLGGYPDGNRSFMLANVSPQTIPVSFFSDASGLPIKAGIYFQLDMSSQILVGAFDPLNDLASVRGEAIGWGDPPSSGLQLFADAARPGIYTNTWLSASQLTGAAFPYKYTYLHSGNGIWEGGDNKSVSFTGSEPVNSAGYHMINLGPTLFDNWQANTNDYLPADTYVTFSVNMSGAQSYSSLIPFDKSMQLAVNGNWLNPWWSWTAAPDDAYVLTNSTTGSDWIFYSKPVLIPKNKPVQLLYKYGFYDNVNSSMDNEAGFGTNHVRYIRATGSYILPLDNWAVPYEEPSIGAVTVGAPSGGHIPVSWLGRPGAYLQTSTDVSNPAAWVNHPETAAYGSPSGIYSTNYPMSSGPIYFRVIRPQ